MLPILFEWNWDPSIWIGMTILVGGYLLLVGPWRTRFSWSEPATRAQKTWFLAGAVVLWFALASPLDAIGDEYLFGAHMTQHVLMTLIAAPMLVLGTPGWLLRPLLKYPLIDRLARFLSHPIVAFALFNGVFVVWHFPGLYDSTLDSETIHIIEHLSFIITAVINWWPVFGAVPELEYLKPPAKLLYLFLEGVPSTILGAIIVFAPNILYTPYLAAPRIFGINAWDDQQIAGLIMAMPAGMVYLVALGGVFFSWMKSEEQKPAESPSETQTSVQETKRLASHL